MTDKTELHQMIDQLTDKQLAAAKEALTNVLQGRYLAVPVCDLGTPEDVTEIYNATVHDELDKN